MSHGTLQHCMKRERETERERESEPVGERQGTHLCCTRRAQLRSQQQQLDNTKLVISNENKQSVTCNIPHMLSADQIPPSVTWPERKGRGGRQDVLSTATGRGASPHQD